MKDRKKGRVKETIQVLSKVTRGT